MPCMLEQNRPRISVDAKIRSVLSHTALERNQETYSR